MILCGTKLNMKCGDLLIHRHFPVLLIARMRQLIMGAEASFKGSVSPDLISIFNVINEIQEP
jgi:hypothetical protein